MTAPSAPSTAASATYTPPPAVARRQRIDAVDLLRGIVMVVMMLDHTRDYVHSGALRYDPTDLSQTTAAVFLTRWITHYCAPVFVFLAGTSAYLQLSRGRSRSELSVFLLKRGLWLVLLELTLVRAAIWFDFSIEYFGQLQVIWAIGVSMIVLAALVRFPTAVVAAFGVVVMVGHNLLDGIRAPVWTGPGSPVPSAMEKLWHLLHQPGGFPVAGWPSPVVFVVYPLIPWIGVIAAGFALGALYEWEPERRRRVLVRLGVAMIVAFVALRLPNVYGDPAPWSVQLSSLFTALSFINTTKYPVSLLFLLMTLGPALVALAWFERRRGGGRIREILVTYGRVPLFFYMMQWVTAHTIGILLAVATGKSSIAHLFSSPPGAFNPPPDHGFGIEVAWAAWLVGVALLYPLCRWFAGVKARRREWWLSYL